MQQTFAAYVYDATTGLAKRTVISDDYATPEALKASHCAVGEDALVVPYDGTFEENRIALAIAQMSEDQVQEAVTKHCGIEPPPKVKYALLGPTGKVFDSVETRRPDDPRLKYNAGFEDAKSIKSADLESALAVVALYPDLALMQAKAITPEMLAAHALVGKAQSYGIVADNIARLDPATDQVQKTIDKSATASGFDVYAGDALKVDDIVLSDGTVAKKIDAPVDVKAVEGDPLAKL